MIIIGGSAVHPLYTRVIVSRSCILAEFAISRFSISELIQPNTEFFSSKYGRFRVDSVTRQGETYIVRAYDPLAYYAKYRVCRQNFSGSGADTWTFEGKAATAVYKVLSTQSDNTTLSDYKITLTPSPVIDPGIITVKLDVRYDMLFDIYTHITEGIDTTCRIDISIPPSYTGNTVYTPEYGSPTPYVFTQPQVIDYAYHASYPTRAVVAGQGTGKDRHTAEVGTGTIETYVNAPYVTAPSELQAIGNNAISAGKNEAENITVKMMARDLPSGLKPADKVKFTAIPDTEYLVQSIEYTTSSRGDIAYVSCGGRVMNIADRINAIIAADYAARY